MSRHETWRTRKYWQEHRHVGRLHLEFPAIPGGKGSGKRLIDGVILHGSLPEIGRISREEIEGAEITVIQTKGKPLGMYLMGQAFFSREIMNRFHPVKIHTVAVCSRGDIEMEAICAVHGIEVWVCPDPV
jgi:hypothetical protein